MFLSGCSLVLRVFAACCTAKLEISYLISEGLLLLPTSGIYLLCPADTGATKHMGGKFLMVKMLFLFRRGIWYSLSTSNELKSSMVLLSGGVIISLSMILNPQSAFCGLFNSALVFTLNTTFDSDNQILFDIVANASMD